MATAGNGDKVRVHYTGKLTDDTVFDSSRERDPLEFELGAHQVISGFEKAVEGLTPGEKTTVEIPAAEAYGPYREEAVLVIGLEQLPPDYQPEVGHQLQSRGEDGRTISAVVKEVTDTTVSLDTNHPLAGKDLIFDIKLVEII
jgi:peptidylprolyl isomerase